MGLVFGQPLENSFHLLAVGISSIPAVVLRCVEYLDSYGKLWFDNTFGRMVAKDFFVNIGLEEVGLYRYHPCLSGWAYKT